MDIFNYGSYLSKCFLNKTIQWLQYYTIQTTSKISNDDNMTEHHLPGLQTSQYNADFVSQVNSHSAVMITTDHLIYCNDIQCFHSTFGCGLEPLTSHSTAAALKVE